MVGQTLTKRVEIMENTVIEMAPLPGRIDTVERKIEMLEQQFLQFRVELRGEFSALRVEFRAELAAAVAPVATRSEMLALHESVRGDIQLLADSVLSLHAKFDARQA